MNVEDQAFSDPAVEEIPTESVPLCDLCGESAREAFASGRDYELQTCRNEWTFVCCKHCGHVWLDPRPSIASLPIIYPTTYYAYTYDDTIPWVARAGKAWLDRRKLAGVLRAVAGPITGFADIGCGTGRYLHAMAAKGVPQNRIHGLELDPEVVARLRQEGFLAHQGRVETCTAIPDGSLTLVTMFHVIEHVESPSAVLSRISDWLAPGGILAIETPNLDSFDARLFKNRWWGGYHFPRHWHLFTPETLKAMLRQHGLEPIAVQYQTGHSFWMYSFHHRLRFGSPGRPAVARLFDPLRSVFLLAGFTLFDLVRGIMGARTSAMLILARRLPLRES